MPSERDRWSNTFYLLSKNILMSRKRDKKEKKTARVLIQRHTGKQHEWCVGRRPVIYVGIPGVSPIMCAASHTRSPQQKSSTKAKIVFRFRAKGKTNKKGIKTFLALICWRIYRDQRYFERIPRKISWNSAEKFSE